MNKNERIEKLEMDIFLLSMKDRWSRADYERNDKMNAELRELKKEAE